MHGRQDRPLRHVAGNTWRANTPAGAPFARHLFGGGAGPAAEDDFCGLAGLSGGRLSPRPTAVLHAPRLRREASQHRPIVSDWCTVHDVFVQSIARPSKLGRRRTPTVGRATCHASHVTSHMSQVTCHKLHAASARPVVSERPFPATPTPPAGAYWQRKRVSSGDLAGRFECQIHWSAVRSYPRSLTIPLRP